MIVDYISEMLPPCRGWPMFAKKKNTSRIVASRIDNKLGERKGRRWMCGGKAMGRGRVTLVLGYLNNVNIQIYHLCLCRRRWSRAEQTFSKAGILCDIGIRTPVRRTSQSTQEKPAPHEGHTHTTRRFHEFIVGHQVRLFVR